MQRQTAGPRLRRVEMPRRWSAGMRGTARCERRGLRFVAALSLPRRAVPGPRGNEGFECSSWHYIQLFSTTNFFCRGASWPDQYFMVQNGFHDDVIKIPHNFRKRRFSPGGWTTFTTFTTVWWFRWFFWGPKCGKCGKCGRWVWCVVSVPTSNLT